MDKVISGNLSQNSFHLVCLLLKMTYQYSISINQLLNKKKKINKRERLMRKNCYKSRSASVLGNNLEKKPTQIHTHRKMNQAYKRRWL